MRRYIHGILGVSLLALLTVGAASPPNLEKTLAAQQTLAGERPYDAEVFNDLGNLLVLDGRRDEAKDAYRKAIELAPESSLPRFNLGVLLQQDGQIRAAASEFRDLLKIDRRHARAHYQLGKLNEARNRRSSALEHYARAFAYDPELTFASNNPHIIDNQLATEAILLSRRFQDEFAAVDLPRLYGEPERIRGMMLEKEAHMEDEAEAVEGGSSSAGGGGGSSAAASGAAGAQFSPGEAADDEADYRLEVEEGDDEGDEAANRRSLTPSDLEVGSSVGQAQRSGGSASSSRRRSPVGIGGRVDARDRSGRRQVNTPPPTPSTRRSTPPRSGRPRYRPASRLSTGRLQLELLPPEPTERLAQNVRRPQAG